MTEILDTFGIPEFFAEALARVDRIGPNRRLIFTISNGPGSSPVAAVKIVVPAEALVEIIQRFVADLHTPKSLASLSPNSLAN